MANTLRSVGLYSQVDKFELSLNRRNEDAAKSTKQTSINTIKILLFSSVQNILMGQKGATTQYLKRTTTS